jgi:hypothetical protein
MKILMFISIFLFELTLLENVLHNQHGIVFLEIFMQ